MTRLVALFKLVQCQCDKVSDVVEVSAVHQLSDLVLMSILMLNGSQQFASAGLIIFTN